MTALLFAALLAQAAPGARPEPAARAAPEKLVMVARPQPSGNWWARVSALARRLYEKPDPLVAEGNARATQNDAQGALSEYDRAREKLPDDGGLAHDRATALLKLGAEKAPEAMSEAARALERGDAKTKPLAAYDQAFALEQLGKPEEAMAAYARTLAFDPEDRDAKVNLELLLRGEEQKKEQPSRQGQPKDEQQKEQQKEQQGKQGKDEQKGKDQKQRQDPQAGDKEKRQKEQDQQQGKPKEKEQAESKKDEPKPGEEKPVDRSEAQRLLDALKAGEKNLQVWRFAKQKTREPRRSDAEKDW